MQNTTIQLTDVTLRDGLQMEANQVSIEEKISLYKALLLCGFSRIEITSFVHPKKIPQFSDAEIFCEKIFALNTNTIPTPNSTTNIETMAFVPNSKGLERLLAFPITWVSAFVAVSEVFNQKNIGLGIQQTLLDLKKMVEKAQKENRKIRVYISTVFGCPYQGKIDDKVLFDTLRKVAELCPDEIALSDTTGVAVPTQVRSILTQFNAFYPKEKTALHLHNTYGLGLANVQEAFNLGIRSFDGSTGGIGGCPYAKGATGNLASEEIFYTFFRQGIFKKFPEVEFKNIFTHLEKLGLVLHSHLSEIATKGAVFYGVNG